MCICACQWKHSVTGFEQKTLLLVISGSKDAEGLLKQFSCCADIRM